MNIETVLNGVENFKELIFVFILSVVGLIIR